MHRVGMILRSWPFRLWLLLMFLIGSSFVTGFKSFKDEQMEHPRVKEAFELHEIDLQVRLLLKGIREDKVRIYIRAFKMEQTVEVWARNVNDRSHQMIADYKFCNTSGRLGPKREQGDHQIPEGYYELIEFNPESNYHLSLKLNYPNASDSVLGNKQKYGGMIFLHGGCATVGCIPINDEMISELYVLSVMAKEAGQDSIPVHIFPARLNRPNIMSLQKSDYPDKTKAFWKSLEEGYSYFEQFGRPPTILIAEDGRYLYRKN